MTEEIERLTLRLEANVRQFENNIRRARGESTRQFRAIEQRTQKMQRRVQALMAGTFTGALLAQFGRSTLRLAGDFEASMNRVQAALGATDKEMSALNAKARDLGKTTQFAASEAADAIEVLAKNGLNAEQILGGAVDASLRLAGALGGDLASSADLATDLMAQFKLDASDLPTIVDRVTGAALKSKFGFDDLRLAIGQAGGVAGSAGVEIEDFITAIAAISPNFTSGSTAGDAFKNMLLRLVPTTKEAQTAMDRLGLEFFDAAGNTKPLEEIAGELRTALQGLSDEARNEVLKKIFGTEGLPAAVALIDQGAEGIRRLKAEIGNVSAEQQAEARMKGLNGALRELNSAWEDLLLTAANGGALDASTAAVQRLTDAIRFLSENFEEIMPWISRIAEALTGVLIAKGLDLTIAAVVGTGLAIKSFIDTMQKAGSGAKTLGTALSLLRGGPLFAVAAIAGITFLQFREGARDSTVALNDLKSKIEDTNATSRRLEDVNRDLAKSKDDLAAASERYRQKVELEGPAAASAAQMEIDAINARIAGREAEAATIAATLKLKQQEVAAAAEAARESLRAPVRRSLIGGELRRRARTGRTRIADPTDAEVDSIIEADARAARERILAGEGTEKDAALNTDFGALIRLERQNEELLENIDNALNGGFRRAEDLITSSIPGTPATTASSEPGGLGRGDTATSDLTPLQQISATEGRRLRDAALQNRLIGKDEPEQAYIETFERIMRDLREAGVTLADLQKDGYASAEDFATDFAKGARAQAEDRLQKEEAARLGDETRQALAESIEKAATDARASIDPNDDARTRIAKDTALEQAEIARLQAIRDRYASTVPEAALPALSAIDRDRQAADRQTALDNAAANAPQGLGAEARALESLRLDKADLERGIRDIASAQEDLARTESDAAQARQRADQEAQEDAAERIALIDKERAEGQAAVDSFIAGADARVAVNERLREALANGINAYEAEQRAIEAETEATRQLNAAKEAGVVITDELAAAVLAAAKLEIQAQQELQRAVEERREADREKQEEAQAATDALTARQQEIDNAAKSAADSITGTFEDIITGAASAEDAVKSLILELGRMTLQKAVLDPISNGASGIIGNLLTGVVGAVSGGGTVAAANGMAFGATGRPVTAFARGGIVNGATNFAYDRGRQLGLMGEAGPEAIMPLRRGPDGKLGVAAGGGGGATTNVTVNISTPNAESFRQSKSQVAASLARAVRHGQRNL